MKIVAATAEQMQDIARKLGGCVAAGDLIMLNGPLGAGKTTFVQGLADGMDVGGRVTSPTFVIAHIHRGNPDLVHVDAYRLESAMDVDGLDLDTSLEDSVTVIEWGRGKTDQLSDDRLEIDIVRPEGGVSEPPEELVDTPRYLAVSATGPRSKVILDQLAELLS